MITGFQYRAAKALFNLLIKDITKEVNLQKDTLVRFGRTNNLQPLKGFTNNVTRLTKFFEDKGLIFPNEHTISLKINLSTLPATTGKLTRFQLKVARIAAGLTQEELSSYIKISSTTISELEHLDNMSYIKSHKVEINTIKRFFEHLGIRFIDDVTITLVQDPKILLKKLISGLTTQ